MKYLPIKEQNDDILTTLFLWTTNNNRVMSLQAVNLVCIHCLPWLCWHAWTVWYSWWDCWLCVCTGRTSTTCQHQIRFISIIAHCSTQNLTDSLLSQSLPLWTTSIKFHINLSITFRAILLLNENIKLHRTSSPSVLVGWKLLMHCVHQDLTRKMSSGNIQISCFCE